MGAASASAMRALPPKLSWAVALTIVAAVGGVDLSQLPPGVGISEMVPAEPEPDEPVGLLEIPKDGFGDEVEDFVDKAMEPRHAVAVCVVGRGTKRHQLIQSLAEDRELYHLLAIGARFMKGKTSLTVHRYGYNATAYEGKWTKTAIRAWLVEHAYPLVNQVKESFPSEKYLSRSPFGVVLVARPKGAETEELARTLEPFALKYPGLKFTIFPKSSDDEAEHLAKACGVWTDDELVLMESPREQNARTHSHVPRNPKYRLEGVTPERLELFFKQYAARSWPRYYVTTVPRSDPAFEDGVRVLTSWDFAETVADPNIAVLVLFVSQDCKACNSFAPAFRELVQKVRDARARDPTGAFRHLLLARIDQSINEHSETVRGTPLLRYWPRGPKKRTVDLDTLRTGSMWDFLEERQSEDLGGASDDAAAEDTCAAGSRGKCDRGGAP